MPLPTAPGAYIRWFAELGLDDIPLVGGKNASLGEMYRVLSTTGVNIPPGFAITADAYHAFLHEAQLHQTITAALQDLDTHDIAALRQRGRQIRQAMMAAPLPAALEAAILNAYDRLSADSHVEAVDVLYRVMLNVGNPEEAFALSFLPNDGVGLAREEFIISNAIKVHPLALLDYERLDDPALRADIDQLTRGYTNKAQFFVDRLAQGVAMIAAAFYPKDVIVRLSDFKSNEYADLLGGRGYEPTEENPMLGFRGAARYYDPRYRDGFALECQAMRQVREEMGLTNVKLMIPFCRTVDEGRQVLAEMQRHGLQQGENGLEVYVMCEIPSNVILAADFAEIFDGFSIGSNDLTQLLLGVDRDSAIVAHLFDERDPAVKAMIASVIHTARATGRKIGICGQAPSDYPDFARFLVEQGIDSISLNPDAVLKTLVAIAAIEQPLARHGR